MSRRPKRRTQAAHDSPSEYMIAAITTVSRNCTLTRPMPPTSATNQRTTRPVYGATTSSRSSTPFAAYSFQSADACSPTTGAFATQSGAAGTLSPRRSFAQLASSSACETMVPIAAENGATKTRSSAIVIAVTASERFRPEPPLGGEHHRPRRDDDHGGPDDRGEERPQDPHRREDQAAEEQHREDGAGEVVSDVGGHGCGGDIPDVTRVR